MRPSMPRDYEDYLRDLLDAIEKILTEMCNEKD